MKPFNGYGGYVPGTFRTPTLRPLLDKMSQIHPIPEVVRPRTRFLSFPIVANPHRPILAGFFPVAKHCPAGTLAGGTIELSVPRTPCSPRRPGLGSFSI